MDLRFTLETAVRDLNEAARNLQEHLDIVSTTSAERAAILSLLPSVQGVLSRLSTGKISVIEAALATGRPSAIESATRAAR